MTKPKRQRQAEDEGQDANVVASFVVSAATGSSRNPAAVALGRLGGRKGGPARAAKLSPKRRKEIAQKAARSRWSRRTPG